MQRSTILKNCYVRNNGRIHPCSCVCIDRNDSRRKEFNLFALWLWHSKLLGYANKAYFAQLTSSGRNLTIVKLRDNTEVAIIPYYELCVVDTIWTAKVRSMGYVDDVGIYPDTKFEEGVLTGTMSHLKCAERGVQPRYLDNSVFVRVDERYVGRNVIHVEFSERTHRVYTKDGRPIGHRVSSPLAYRRWGVKLPTRDSDVGLITTS